MFDFEEVFKCFKGVKLYEIIDIVFFEYGVMLVKIEVEYVYCVEVVWLFDLELEVIEGVGVFLLVIIVLMCVVFNGLNNKM